MCKSDLKYTAKDLLNTDFNILRDLSKPETRLEIVNYLDAIHSEMARKLDEEAYKDSKAEADLLVQIEAVLQMLGAPGYEFN